MPRLLGQAGLGGASVLVAGDTAIASETVDRIQHDMLWVALAAFLVNFVLLALFLRAIVAPILLIVASALGLAATFGLATFVFQGLLGWDELTYYVPLAVGVLLLSFGSDYNLFVVGRIWQESERRGVARRDPARDAAREPRDLGRRDSRSRSRSRRSRSCRCGRSASSPSRSRPAS